MVSKSTYHRLAGQILYKAELEGSRLYGPHLGQMAVIRARTDGSNAWISQVDTAVQLPDRSIRPVYVDASLFPAEYLGALVDYMIHFKVDDVIAVNTYIFPDNTLRRGLAVGDGLHVGVITPNTWLNVMKSISPTKYLKKS